MHGGALVVVVEIQESEGARPWRAGDGSSDASAEYLRS